MASGLNDPPLMHGKRTEIALAEAAPVGGEAQLDLAQCRDAAVLPVHGMVIPHIGKVINIVHFQLGKRLGRGILYHKEGPVIAFIDSLRRKGIGVSVLYGEALRITLRTRLDFFKVRQTDGIVNAVLLPGLVHRSLDPADIGYGNAGGQRIRDLHDAVLSHAVGNEIRTGIQKDGALHPVGPVIIVAETPQTGLNAADDDGHMLIAPPDHIAVYRHRPVRPLSHHTARCVGIGLPVPLGHGIVIDHGIHVAGGNQEAETRLPELPHALRLMPVRLAEHTYRIAVGLQDPADDGGAEAGMVHIGIAAKIDKVRLCDALFQHILPVYR